MNEEVIIRMGMDARKVGSGLGSLRKDVSGWASNAKQELSGFSNHAAKSFVHVGSAGRAFHKVLEGISEQSPVMGGALKFALSPVVGILAGIGLGFSFVKRKLEEFNTLLDKVAESNAKSLGDLKAAIAKAHTEMIEDRKAFNSMVRELISPLQDIEDRLKREEDQLRRNYQVAKARRDLEKGAVIDFLDKQPGTPEEKATKRKAIEGHYTAEEARAKSKELREQIALQTKWLALVDEARKKVAGDVLGHDAPGAEAARLKRRTVIGKADTEIAAMREALTAQKAIKDSLEADYQAGKAAYDEGKGAFVRYAALHPDIMAKRDQYKEAERMIESYNRAIEKQTKIKERLEEQDKAESEAHKMRIGDLKELDSQHNKYSQSLYDLNADLSQIAATPLAYTPPKGLGYPGMPGRPDLDARTGGYPLRPIGFNSLRGAVDLGNDAGSASTTQLKDLNDKMDALLKAATQDGMKMIPEMGK
jgi:hypothetical protein